MSEEIYFTQSAPCELVSTSSEQRELQVIQQSASELSEKLLYAVGKLQGMRTRLLGDLDEVELPKATLHAENVPQPVRSELEELRHTMDYCFDIFGRLDSHIIALERI